MISLIVKQVKEPKLNKKYHHVFWFNGDCWNLSLKGRKFIKINLGNWLSSQGFALIFIPK